MQILWIYILVVTTVFSDFCFSSGCHEQGYAGNIIVYGICVWSFNIWTRCSASHIQIGPRLACLNLLAMQPSTPISAYHHIKIIHTRIHIWLYCENRYNTVHTYIHSCIHITYIAFARYIAWICRCNHAYTDVRIFSRP